MRMWLVLTTRARGRSPIVRLPKARSLSWRQVEFLRTKKDAPMEALRLLTQFPRARQHRNWRSSIVNSSRGKVMASGNSAIHAESAHGAIDDLHEYLAAHSQLSADSQEML